VDVRKSYNTFFDTSEEHATGVDGVKSPTESFAVHYVVLGATSAVAVIGSLFAIFGVRLVG